MSDGLQATAVNSEGFSPTLAPPPARTFVADDSANTSTSATSTAGPSATDVAKDQAGEMAATAQQAGSQIKETVTEQAGAVTAEAGRQAKQLLDQARTELTDQAAVQQQRVAGGLQSLADELDGMVQGSAQDGMATDLARMGAEKARDVAQWLDGRDPGSLLDEVRSYARRRPGTYLAIALGAGVLAGRLTRGLTAPAESAADTDPSGTAASRPVMGYDPTTTSRPELDGFQPVPAIGYGNGVGNGVGNGTGYGNGDIGAFGSVGDVASDPEMIPGHIAAPPSSGLGTGPILGGPQGDPQR